jgi:hypothetical protein
VNPNLSCPPFAARSDGVKLKRSLFGGLCAAVFFLFLAGIGSVARGEAMLQLFNVNWPDLIQKMPEIAEAGYDSLWLPPPAKGSSVYSVGYDHFDPFDLGDKNQRGTVATHWGTKAQLLQVVETAHRFGIRVYFDNIMNHRAFDVPGFNASTPTNLYPGLLPQDFHLQSLGGGRYANWPSVQDYGNQWDVQNESLSGLVDLANEPGSINNNFGATLGSTAAKLSFIRHPGSNSYYMDPALPAIEGGPWHPFNGSSGVPVTEDVNSFLIRAVMWMVNETKCDGFRLDAVKHVPSGFFGDSTATWSGYTGGIQAMFDYVHGFGTNVLGNGYFEPDNSRNSCFDTEAPRNDAVLFGEHLGQPPTFSEYLARGMRLLNAPLRDQLNSALGGSASLSGMDQRDYVPYSGAFSAAQSVMFAQSHDASGCCATHRDLHNAYYFMHEGIPEIYSDNYNQSGPPNYFPNPPHANYLGEFGDPTMPDMCLLHNQLARGGTSPRWSDFNIVAFERYDTRDGSGSGPQDQDVVLFVMNDKYSFPGDISFDDGVAQADDGYYGSQPVSNSRNLGLVVGFPPGTVLAQLSASGQNAGGNRAYRKLLVHGATKILATAQATANDPNPVNRLIYVGGQTLASGGGAIELLIPSGSWVMYGMQWPEASRASLRDAITFRQGGAEAPRITVYRQDGLNGDPNFNPVYPFQMRGSVNASGAVIGGTNTGTRTYAIDIPVLTNAPFDILVRNDASSANTLVKLDGGTDLNSQMGLGPTTGGVGPNGPDLRDNRPGYATDVYLGYEQTALQFRNGPEKFAARNILSNNVVSLGAETYCYTNDGASTVTPGSGDGASMTNQTAAWVWHDPTNSVTSLSPNPPTQRNPLNPASGQSVDVWVKVGYQFQINTCYLYYTTDGSNPEGSFGTGKGTTQVVQAFWVDHDSATNNIDWWKGTIPAQGANTAVQYKVALFYGGSVYAGQNIQPISDAEPSGSKLYGLTQTTITNFNPTTAVVWRHNDLNTNSTAIGLPAGFHIARARTFLPRTNQASVYNTFAQTFYYDAALPTGAIALPATNGASISNSAYTIVVRGDSTVVGVEVNVQDSNPANDDAVTGQNNGNGLTNGIPAFAAATPASADPNLGVQYPNYPQEFHFTYAAVPNSGTATLTIHLKEYATAVYPNRITTLTRTVNTVAPSQVVLISNPAADGTVITMDSSSTYPLRTCFTSTLDTNNINLFSIYINGIFQLRRDPNTQLPYYFITGTGCGSGMRMLTYNWGGAPVGTNVIQVVYTNSIILSDARTVIVAPPLFISDLSGDNQLITWDSAPGVNYQVLATTNLTLPFEPISDIIQGAGPSTFYFDATAPVPEKFFRIEVVP